MPEIKSLPKWAQEAITLQVQKIKSLELQVATLEGEITESPVSRLNLLEESPVPNDKYRFRLTDDSYVDVRISKISLSGERLEPILDINGSGYLTIAPIISNHIQLWSRDRFI